ncbi:MAG: branched-chain amino acid ABC transporter ATP-binding protein/permease, partial [Candidatus Rokubacteria bacterium]|nr:branched-chain amino acid ABC transporter ATP-binding protein/permease [Candidatus Rokubacteria bacterium]
GVVVIAWPWVANETWTTLAMMAGINVLLAQSINVLTGYAGQISLGQAGFFAIGGYTSALLMMELGFPLWLSLPAAVMAAALVGVALAIPAGRVQDFYLAMVTAAFGLVVQVIVKQWDLTGGFQGLSGVPAPVLGNLTLLGLTLSERRYYYLIAATVAIASWFQVNLVRSFLGRAFVAVETSEIAAASLGISPGAAKRQAYMVSAALAALAGGLYGHLMAFLGYETFSLWQSAFILVMAVLGGLGTFVGPFLGAIVLTVLPHELQIFRTHQLLIYGALLLVSYLAFPRGLAGLLRLRESFLKVRPALATAAEREAGPASTGQGGPLLLIESLAKSFAGVRALNGVSMAVMPGEIHGLIGPNGSGKTTLVNLVSGVYEIDAGTVTFAGERLNGLPPHLVARRGVVRTFQNPHIFRRLSVRENLMVGAHPHFAAGFWSAVANLPGAVADERHLLDKADAILGQVGLVERADALAIDLPYGIQRMVDVARAMMCRPRLIILDEPAAGLSEVELAHLASVLRSLRAAGVTILLIEHHLDFLLGLVDRVTVLDYGETIFEGTPNEVRRDPRVIEAYLGVYASAGA